MVYGNMEKRKKVHEALDEIMKNQYIDGYIIGANDLSGSINELCNVFGENTTSLIKTAIKNKQ